MWRSAVQVCLGLHIARLVQCARVASLPWDYASHRSAMYMGSEGVVFNIGDSNVKLYQSLKPFIWGISSVG